MRLQLSTLIIVGGILSFCVGLFGQDSDREALFRQTFGYAPPKIETPFLVSVIVDDYYVGEMEIKQNASTGQISLPPARVKNLLETILTEDAIKELEAFVLQPSIPDPVISKLGYRLSFNQRRLTLEIITPPEKRRSKEIPVSSRPQNRQRLRPTPQRSPLSGYLNVRGSTLSEQFSDLWDPLNLNLESVLTMDKVTYRTFGNFSSTGQGSFGFHQFIHDDPKHFVRYSLGDLLSQDVGMMNGLPIVGLRMQKQERLFSVTPANNTFTYEFFLEEASTVEIFINDEMRSRKFLQAGFVTLSDFPLDLGRNDIKIDIIVSQNIVKSYTKTTIFDEVLDSSLPYRYMLAAGVDQRNGDLFQSEGYYLKRFSPIHSSGPLYQSTSDTLLIGERLRHLFVYGSLDADIGGLLSNQNNIALGTGLQFSSYQVPLFERSRLRYAITLRNFGQDFISRYSNNGERRWFLSPSLFLSFHNNLTLNLNSYYIQNQSGEQSLDFSTIFSWRLKNTAFQFNFRSIEGLNGKKTWEITNRINVFIGQDSIRVAKTNNENGTQTTSLSWNRRARGNSFSRFNANVDYIDTSNSNYVLGYSGANKIANINASQDNGYWNYLEFLQYENHRGRIQLTTQQNNTDSGQLNTTGVAFSTGVAFVGKEWGITHDLNQSFALVYPEKQLKKYRFTIDKNRRTDWLGGVVVPNIASFVNNEISITDTNMPIGSALDSRFFNVAPSSFTGVGIELRGRTGVILKGRIEDTQGKAITLYTGTLTEIGPEEAKSILFFTSSKGTFLIEQIKPGAYTLSLPGSEFEDINIQVKKEKSEIVNIGRVQLKKMPYNKKKD